jgi:hypothetical protein
MYNRMVMGRNPADGTKANRIIRALVVSLSLVLLVVLASVVGTAWHNHDSVSESHCPYCHLSHQTAGQPETSQRIAALSPLCVLLLSEYSARVSAPDSSLTPARAPPSA